MIINNKLLTGLLLLVCCCTLLKSMEEREKEPFEREKSSIKTFEQWDELPLEVKENILSFVPDVKNYQDWLKLVLVNKEINALASSENFLTNFAKRLFTHNPIGAKELLQDAVNNGNIALTKALINAHETLAQQAEEMFLDAAARGDLKQIMLLEQAGININAQNAKNLDTALILAAFRGHGDIGQWLINHGADIKQKNKDGLSALQLASGRGLKALVNLLIEKGADVNDQDDRLVTPLIAAASNSHYDIAKTLLEHGADPNHAQFAWDKTPLLAALDNKDLAMVKLLIEHGADVDRPNKYYQTARELIERDQPALLEWLKKTEESTSGH